MSEQQEEAPTAILLQHELVEVLLLLDHISSVRAKKLPTVLEKEPVFGSKAEQEEGRDWIKQICEIAWPPDADEKRARQYLGENAAKLLRAKDILNYYAAPATGESVAFSVMIVEREAGRFWRKLLGIFGLPPGRSDAGPGEAHLPGNQPLQKRTRVDLAAAAYPDLARAAFGYRLHMIGFVGFLIASLICTCILSWDVATGTALLNRYNSLEARIVDLHKASTAQTMAGGSGSAACPIARPDGGCPGVLPGSAAERARQSDLDRATQQQEIVARSLRTWLNRDRWPRNALINLMGGHGQVRIWNQPQVEERDVQVNLRRNNDYIEWAAVALGVLAGTILPIFYGLIGACAAVVRIISAKVRDSILLPRDIWLGYIRLALGGVIGACVGLFVTPNGMPSEPAGLLGTVHLSAAALCFVAGFGVEGVFQALEELVRRLFNLDPARTPTPGSDRTDALRSGDLP